MRDLRLCCPYPFFHLLNCSPNFSISLMSMVDNHDIVTIYILRFVRENCQNYIPYLFHCNNSLICARYVQHLCITLVYIISNCDLNNPNLFYLVHGHARFFHVKYFSFVDCKCFYIYKLYVNCYVEWCSEWG